MSAPKAGPRSYVVGVPLAITVSPDGAVTLDVDLTEIGDMEDLEENYGAQFMLDVLTVEAAAGRLGNALTFTIHPARSA